MDYVVTRKQNTYFFDLEDGTKMIIPLDMFQPITLRDGTKCDDFSHRYDSEFEYDELVAALLRVRRGGDWIEREIVDRAISLGCHNRNFLSQCAAMWDAGELVPKILDRQNWPYVVQMIKEDIGYMSDGLYGEILVRRLTKIFPQYKEALPDFLRYKGDDRRELLLSNRLAQRTLKNVQHRYEMAEEMRQEVLERAQRGKLMPFFMAWNNEVELSTALDRYFDLFIESYDSCKMYHIDMEENYDPSDPYESHKRILDIAQKKRDEGKERRFKMAQNYVDLHYEDDDWYVEVPETYEDLVRIGNEFNNCFAHWEYEHRTSTGHYACAVIRSKNDADEACIDIELEEGHIDQFYLKNNEEVNDNHWALHQFKKKLDYHYLCIWPAWTNGLDPETGEVVLEQDDNDEDQW